MKLYQLTYLISPDLNEEELKKTTQTIEELIQTNEGNLAKVEKPIKTRLGSPIRHKDSAFLNSLNFYINSEKLENLLQKLSALESILRFSINIKKTQKTKIKTAKLFGRKKWAPEKGKKVELKEIEKKLGEILGE